MFLWTVYNLWSRKRKIFYSIIFFILNFFTVTYFCYYHFFLLSSLASNYSWNLTIVCLADWDFFFSRESSSNLKPSLLIMKCLISAKQLFELHNLLFLPLFIGDSFENVFWVVVSLYRMLCIKKYTALLYSNKEKLSKFFFIYFNEIGDLSLWCYNQLYYTSSYKFSHTYVYSGWTGSLLFKGDGKFFSRS